MTDFEPIEINKITMRLINEGGIHPSEEEAREAASRLEPFNDPRLSYGEPFYSERDKGWYVEILGFDKIANG